MPKIYTRRGDEGETGLLYGGRVSKSDLRCEACGAIDEAVSALGLARFLVEVEILRAIILEVQRELFVVGGELATDPSEYSKLVKHFSVVTPEMVNRLEVLIDELNGQMTLPNAFIIPGATAASSALDLGRSILRRAERRVVALMEQDLLGNPLVLQYLNRLSDLIFVMARYEDKELPVEALTGDSKSHWWSVFSSSHSLENSKDGYRISVEIFSEGSNASSTEQSSPVRIPSGGARGATLAFANPKNRKNRIGGRVRERHTSRRGDILLPAKRRS